MGAPKETLGFQAEVKQLLRLMIHSLYSNKQPINLWPFILYLLNQSTPIYSLVG